jgi:DNA-binding SARP family transcriptional activator/tetratricopeptide (TPR) repeat protein
MNPAPFFRILGPLEITIDGRPLSPGGMIPACVLGMLLLEPRRALPVYRLAAAVWDGELPDTGLHQVRKAVSMLRGRLPDGKRLISTEGDGYCLNVGEEQFDAGLFSIRLRRARQAEADGLSSNAVGEYQAALALWRGTVLQGTGGVTLAGASRSLEELRMRTAEDCLSLRARLGETASLVSELRALTAQEPLREPLRHQLILALYRSGRQAEALEEFEAVRALLSEELGISPGTELAALHEAVLRQSPDLQAPHPPSPRPEDALPAPPVALLTQAPNTLPYGISDFIGRRDELRALLNLGREASGAGTRIIALDGMGGVGKTALAIRAGHLLTEEYPDAQLYVDLRGYTHGSTPLESEAALDYLLRLMGVPGPQVPEDYLTRVALWRSVTARLRMILVLDNAGHPDQVRDLIPGSPRCLVLVTSRPRLIDIPGASWRTLGLMSEAECTDLAGSILGQDRIEAEPDALADLVQLCGRLPLALRIAASRVGRRSEWTIRHMTDLLSDETRRVRELSSGQHSIAATLALSYNSMPGQHRTAFRLLAWHPGLSISRLCAAALLDVSVEETDRILEHILDIHLIQQLTWDRYVFHDLARRFALELKEGGNKTDAGPAERLLRYYMHATTRACDVLFPGRMRYSFDPGSPAAMPLPEFPDQQAALQWLNVEEAAIRASIDLGFEAGLYPDTAMLARNFSFYLNSQGYYDEYCSVTGYAVAAARKLDDQLLLCVSLTNLAVGVWKTGDFAKASVALEEALDLARQAGDERMEAAALGRLGLVRWSLGQCGEALTSYYAALDLHRQHGSDREAAETLGNVCDVLRLLGRTGEAVAAGSAAVDIARSIGDQASEASALTEVAYAYLDLDDQEAAMKCIDHALELADATQALLVNAAAMICRGAVLLQRGALVEAGQCAEDALNLAQARGARISRMMAENLLGRIYLARGDAAASLSFYQRSYAQSSAIGLIRVAARASAGAASALRELGRADEAAGCQADADRMFDEMGVPIAARARTI